MNNTIKKRLEYIRKEIEAERISTGEILELQSLAEYIEPGDVLLLEWAGVPETKEGEMPEQRIVNPSLLIKVPHICDECEQEFQIDGAGIAQHVTEDGDIDHDQDAHHVPYELPEDKED